MLSRRIIYINMYITYPSVGFSGWAWFTKVGFLPAACRDSIFTLT